MNLYLISQNVNNGYDTYDSSVVCADSEYNARLINPEEISIEEWEKEGDCCCGSWVNFSQIDKIKVEFIGVADKNIKKGVVCASFNAG